MRFLGLGVPELVIILVVILLIFGPKNLPKLGSAIGRTVKSLRDGMDENKDKDKPEDAEGQVAEEVEAQATEADEEEKPAAESPKQE